MNTKPSNPSEPLRSCVYECTILHHRLKPKEHRFSHPVFMMFLDLDELQFVTQRLRSFSWNRFNAYSFYDSDHLGGRPRELKDSLRAWLAPHGVTLPPDARIALLTFPRVFGYVFNPVSFYFCSNSMGKPLCAIAEVGNTFGEKKLFLVPISGADDNAFRVRVPKNFYVSPFSGLNTEFEFKLRHPEARLGASVDEWENGERSLLSALNGRRESLSDRRLAWFLFKYPLLTLKVLFLIHWHALLLWFKRVPFHRKADRPELQQEVINPHVSISSKLS